MTDDSQLASHIRLQKVIAQSGIASRRHAEALITAGRVAVNGQVVTQLGTKVDPARDLVVIDGRTIVLAGQDPGVLPGAGVLPDKGAMHDADTLSYAPPGAAMDEVGIALDFLGQPLEYWALHKPIGVVTTLDDPQGRPTVGQLIAHFTRARVYPVGRLDVGSSGLLLMTNDGDLANRLMHPRFAHEKEYHVQVTGSLGAGELDRLRNGVELDGQLTAPAVFEWMGAPPQDGRTGRLRVVLREGRKRQIRRMIEAVGGRVVQLVRVRMGPLWLADVAVGQARRLTEAQVAALKASPAQERPATQVAGSPV